MDQHHISGSPGACWNSKAGIHRGPDVDGPSKANETNGRYSHLIDHTRRGNG